MTLASNRWLKQVVLLAIDYYWKRMGLQVVTGNLICCLSSGM